MAPKHPSLRLAIFGPKEEVGKRRLRAHCLTRSGCHTDLGSAQPVDHAGAAGEVIHTTHPSWLLGRLLAPSCAKGASPCR